MSKDFSDILKESTRKIDENYFKTKIIRNNCMVGVYRERVYCYELYHQMRGAWPTDSTLILCAEFDKSGSQLFSGSTVKGVKPDFLVHVPGNMESNLVAIEVKPSTVGKPGITKDLDKLSKLLNEIKYKIGVYLIYGYEAKIKAKLAISLLSSNQKNIQIWFHENPLSCAEVFENDTSHADRLCSVV